MQRIVRDAEFIPRLTRSRLANVFLLFVCYFTIAAAAFNGFYDKWDFRNNDPKFSFAAMVDGTADRPYVYRQLLPILANAAEGALPNSLREWLTNALYAKTGLLKSGISAPVALDREYALRYHFIYYATFLFILASLFVLREICRTAGFGPLVSTIAPGLFMLFMPFIQSVGGFFYDFTELFLMASAVLLAMKNRLYALIPLTVLGTMNKESFLFFVVTLFPFVRERLSFERTLALLGTLILVAGITYLAIRMPYADNPGHTAHNHVLEGLLFYLNPLSLVGREITYGLKTFAGYSFVSVALFALLAIRGWHGLSLPVRRHIIVAAAINLPLFLLLCYPGEMRNLSMLYVGFVLLLAQNLADLDRTEERRVDAPEPRS